MKISILMLTYNAPRYTAKAILSLKKTETNIPYELIVVDNKSKFRTRRLLNKLFEKGLIDKLHFNDHNALFAKGNNIASRFAAEDATHYLLLNSDVEVIDPKWLDKLCELHETKGISSLGAVMYKPIRADGYCLLIDKELYDRYKLDEQYEWWWSVTKLESEVLKEGLMIRAVKNHDNLLIHYGGRSGKGYKHAKGMDTDIKEVVSWFQNSKNSVKILETL